MIRLCRTLPRLLLVVPLLFAVTTSPAEERLPSATVVIETTSIAVGVGVTWGDGTLSLNDGKQYPFSMKGLKVGGLGFAKVHAVGKV